MTIEELVNDLVISVEHGHLCFRTADQWLLHSLRPEEIPDAGVPLKEVVPLLHKGHETVRLEKESSRE